MIDLIYKVKNSEPTITGEKALEFFVAIVTHPDWVILSSAVLGLDDTIQKSNDFISYLARIELHGESLLTIQPLHVLYSEDLNDGWDRMWGLVYSNGAFCYSEKDNGEQFVVLFLDQSLVDQDSIYELPVDFTKEPLA